MGRALLASVAAVACATAKPPVDIPEGSEAREAWVTALSSGDSARVWAMLGPEARSRFDGPAGFESWCRRYCPDLLVSAMADSAAADQTVVVGGHTRLRRSGERWVVLESDYLSLERSALATLQRFERRTRAWVMSVGLHSERRARILTFLQRLAERLREPLPEAKDAQLVLPLEGGGWVRLKKAGRWEVQQWDWH